MKNIVEIDGVKYEQILKKVEESDCNEISELKIGEKVKVKYFTETQIVHVMKEMYGFINNVYTIVSCSFDKGYELKDANGNSCFFPYFVIEKVEEPIEPKIETYNDILKAINPMWAINTDGNVIKCSNAGYMYFDQYASEEHAQIASARLKLENVAYYLNEIKYKDKKWGVTAYNFDLQEDFLKITNSQYKKFKSYTIAHEAIMILGEEIIKLSLK